MRRKATSDSAPPLERMFSLEEVAEYHKVAVERIHALADAGHFGPTYKQRRGRGLSRASYVPESAMTRHLPKDRTEA